MLFRHIRVLICLLIFSVFLGACQPALTPAARPTPLILHAQVTPSLRNLSEDFHACANQEEIGLVVLETTTADLDLSSADITLRRGEPNPLEGYTAVIGYEELAAVIHPDNAVEQLTLNEVIGLYEGMIDNWAEVSAASAGVELPEDEVQPWVYPPGEDVQQVLAGNFVEETGIEGEAYRSPAHLAPDPQAARDAVSQNLGAIAFLPRSWIDSSVKAVEIEGLDHAQMRQPILAISSSEPAGAARSWLLCLQSRLSGE